MDFLSFSKGNSKLSKSTLIFSLPAGRTCPGAEKCLSYVLEQRGKRRVVDGPLTVFRCFAASSEALYDRAFRYRARNLRLIVNALARGGPDAAAELLHASLQEAAKGRRKIKLVRIHESGDFFSQAYLRAWLKVAQLEPDLKFYCYSKSLHLFLDEVVPSNFYLTASYGGRYDRYILEGRFSRWATVVHNEDEAQSLGLEIDHDDSHCFRYGPFALLVHGVQPVKSTYGRAISARRRSGQFSGYSRKS